MRNQNHQKQTKSPTSSSAKRSIHNNSQSPNTSSVKRDSTPLYSLNSNIIGVSVRKSKSRKNPQPKEGLNQKSKKLQQSRSFAGRRLSMSKKNSSKPPAKLVEHQSLNQSIGEESLYSGEGYISKSIQGSATSQFRKSKSPKASMINLKKKSTNSSINPVIQVPAQQQHSHPTHSKKWNSSTTYSGPQNQAEFYQNNSQNVNPPKCNNYMIESNINASQYSTSTKSKQHSLSTKSNGLTKVYTTTTGQPIKQVVSATNKVNQSFTSGTGSQKFQERRLSCKVLDNQKKSNTKQTVQYENLMIQQLLKQQQQDQQNIKKNMSVISIDQNPPSTQQIFNLKTFQNRIAPHMMLNISYNMNNNINHNGLTADQHHTFLFQNSQDPTAAQIKTLIGFSSQDNANLNTNQLNNNKKNNQILDQSQVKLQFKTQIDKSKVKTKSQGKASVGIASPSQLDQQMTYDNSIVQALKGSDLKFREQSFDNIYAKKKQQNNRRSKQNQIISGRRQSSGKGGSASRSNSSKRRSSMGNNYKSQGAMRPSSRVFSSNNPTSTHSNSSNNQNNKLTNQKFNFKKNRQSMTQIETKNKESIQPDSKQQSEDRYLLQRLDEALTRDLQEKSSAQRVAICSKVWTEIIRRELDPVISSLLQKIKHSYESHIKSQNKLLTQQQKEIDYEQELKKEMQERKSAESKIENLGVELKKQQACIEKQELVIQDMKKQILAYRQEIIELSTSKKQRDQRGGKKKREVQDYDNMRVPRLDLSKVKRDSDDDDDDDDSSDEKKQKKKNSENEITYQQYLKFLENESRFEDLGEESQESILRQEELKQRKNKIIQLLNGEISDEEENADLIDQSSGGEEADHYEHEEDEFVEPDYIQEMELADIEEITTVKKQLKAQKQDITKKVHQNIALNEDSSKKANQFHFDLDDDEDVDLLRNKKSAQSF